jgi:hypothetical protein
MKCQQDLLGFLLKFGDGNELLRIQAKAKRPIKKM